MKMQAKESAQYTIRGIPHEVDRALRKKQLDFSGA